MAPLTTGLPAPVAEDAPTSTEADDGKSYRIAATERQLFEHQPEATHFRYPWVYGPRQLAPREWSVVRRILDDRPHIVLPDGGAMLNTFGFTEILRTPCCSPSTNPGRPRARSSTPQMTSA